MSMIGQEKPRKKAENSNTFKAPFSCFLKAGKHKELCAFILHWDSQSMKPVLAELNAYEVLFHVQTSPLRDSELS